MTLFPLHHRAPAGPKSGLPRLGPSACVMLLLGCALCGCGPFVDGLFVLLTASDRFGEDPGEPVYEPQAFVNWETPHVSPLDLTPDGARLLAVNTPDNRLQVIDITGDQPAPLASIFTGLEPVSVRARGDNEAWVVNHLSDSVSIVDLEAGCVVQTLLPGDEPTDVAFAAGRAFVVCSQLNQVAVYDLTDLDAPPKRLDIAGEDPRAIAVSPDGERVFVAIFESGNGTTIIPGTVVSDPASPYGGQNPVPRYNDPLWDLAADLPPAATVALIVRKDPQTGAWLDDNGADWSAFVTWDLHDHDLAIIDARTLEIDYVESLMNLNMALAARPDGAVTVVGTEADNLTRFEPNLTGRFVRSVLATVDPAAPLTAVLRDLNPHLEDAYARKLPAVDAQTRALSIADPRAVVWSADGGAGYVAGLGSDNVIRIDAAGERTGQIDVGAGATGLRLSADGARLFVLSKFDASVTVIDTATFTQTARVELFDPTPKVIREGRPFLYDARRTSGLGVTACAACHVDGRMDQLAWDLGNPAGLVKPFDQDCDDFGSGPFSIECGDFHPLKGPMTTQTLQGIIGVEPLHWRGDRASLAEFNPAFVDLDGAERELTAQEMAQFEAFLATIQFPPNPFRNLDNSLRDSLADGAPLAAGLEDGSPGRGRDVFVNQAFDGLNFVQTGVLTCNRCHQLPLGTNQAITPADRLLTSQSAKVPHLRNMHEKTGFSTGSQENNRGFGFTHSGQFATIHDFLHFDVFRFGDNEADAQARRDVIAFVMSLGVDTHAGVGAQATLDGVNDKRADVGARLDLLRALADKGDVGLIVKGRYQGAPRGFAYVGDGQLLADDGATISFDALRAAAGPGAELTWTLTPLGAEIRMGIDRDSDGVFDALED